MKQSHVAFKSNKSQKKAKQMGSSIVAHLPEQEWTQRNFQVIMKHAFHVECVDTFMAMDSSSSPKSPLLLPASYNEEMDTGGTI